MNNKSFNFYDDANTPEANNLFLFVMTAVIIICCVVGIVG